MQKNRKDQENTNGLVLLLIKQSRLLRDLPESVNVQDDLIEKAKILDNFYIPSRYPNSHPEGAPFEHYGPIHSEEAIKYAREIVEFVRSQMAKSRRSD